MHFKSIRIPDWIHRFVFTISNNKLLKTILSASAIIVIILTIVIPFGYSFTSRILQTDPSTIPALLSVIVIAVWISMHFQKALTNPSKHTVQQILFLTLLFGFLLRLNYILLLDPQPVSDFLASYLCAKHDLFDTPNMSTYYSKFPYYAFYAVCTQGFMSLFGSGIPSMQAISIGIHLTTGIALFLTGYLAFKSYSYGFFSLLLYMVWPELSIYAGVLSGEHLAMMFLVLMTLFWILASESSATTWDGLAKLIGYSALSGLAGGLFHGFRALMPIALVAMILHETTNWARRSERIASEKAIISIISSFTKFGVFCLTLLLTGNSITHLIEHKINRPVDSITGNYTELIYYGIHPIGKGRYNTEVVSEIRQLYQDHGDPGAQAEMTKRIKTLILSNTSAFIDILGHKLNINWASDINASYWATSYDKRYEHSSSDQHIDIDRNAMVASGWYRAQGTYRAISDSFYTVLMFLCLMGCVRVIISRDQWTSQLLLVCLMILGFCILGLMIQAQERYKSVFSPYVCILGGVGMTHIACIIRSARLFRRQVLAKQEGEPG